MCTPGEGLEDLQDLEVTIAVRASEPDDTSLVQTQKALMLHVLVTERSTSSAVTTGNSTESFWARHSLHPDLCLPCSKMDAPPQSLHVDLTLPRKSETHRTLYTETSSCRARRWMPHPTPYTCVSASCILHPMNANGYPTALLAARHFPTVLADSCPAALRALNFSSCDARSVMSSHFRCRSALSCPGTSLLWSGPPSSQIYPRQALQTG